ncbi:MAG TPA: metallophosphoesterase family protein [Candidatus Woesebacteria bacterium]|nr:metallophosphoesterase family protein [Candidatus Woesebacteria bacterium]
MNILVFSDTHLNLPFEEKKFNFLKDLINKSDKVIINGDFWEGYFISFKQFLDSPWKNLFHLLKQKQAVYIFGNHDRERFSTEEISAFSTIQTNKYSLKFQDKTYIFEHGNRIVPLENGDVAVSGKPNIMTQIADQIEKYIIKTGGALYQKGLYHYNKQIKEKIRLELKYNEIFVCGHTHCAEVDEKNKFINTGIIKHGLAQYMFITNGAAIPKQERYL